MFKFRLIAVIILIWGLYCGVTLLTPQDPSVNRFNISPITLNLVIISVTIPYLICWLFAALGWFHIREFTRKKSAGLERDGFAKIKWGLLALVASLIVPTVVQVAYRYIAHDTAGASWNIFYNYLGIFFPLVGFLLMFIGSAQIVSKITPKITWLSRTTTALFPVALFSVFYLFMVFANPSRQVSSDPSVEPTYFLPDPMIIGTIILPVVATWFFGLLMVLNLQHYSHYSKTIYRPGLVSFYNGVIVIVAITMLTQVLASLGGSRLSNLNLGAILAIVYIFLGILAAGYGLIAHGAKKLQPQAPNTRSDK